MKNYNVGRLVAIALAIMIVMGGLFVASPASASTSSDFVSSINGLRSSKGLGNLSVDGSLSGQAQSWAQKMADAGKISHNPNLGGTPGNWTKVGENVGTGGDVSSIFNALVNSPGHYRNMVDGDFNKIGVGSVVGSDGRIYTCHVFASFPGASSSAKSSAPASSNASSAPAKKTATPAPAAPSKPKTTTKPAAPKTATKTEAPANTPAEAAPTSVESAPVAPALPAPSPRIVAGLVEVGSISTQG